jgi:DNA-binding MarR family transcriptional regulator
MKENHINEMRSFNRFYTAVIGVLNNKFLNSKYSLPDLRVLQAIFFKEGITASDIIETLNIDKSYLSRILLRLEKDKLIIRKASPLDGRSYHLHLTLRGKKEYQEHDKASDKHINEMLARLDDRERNRLISSMQLIKNILSKPVFTKKR